MSFKQMMASGLYFVTSKTAFTIPYLELCYYRLLRAKTSPGQERHLVHTESLAMFWQHHSFRDHLLMLWRGMLWQGVPQMKSFHSIWIIQPSMWSRSRTLCFYFILSSLSASRLTVAKKGRPMKLLPEQ